MCKAAAGGEPENREQRVRTGAMCWGRVDCCCPACLWAASVTFSKGGVIRPTEQNLARIIKTSLHFVKLPSEISKHFT